ncbi:hypothetical protein SK128_022510 [Halocaridina rubra]|uniref:Uncharacterized protein n=1 Tax=Halocaridina rubra TaxID=373956 RepID=A0AAN8XKP5_HALRR
MCRDGRRQSPINVDPKTLLFDPNLSPFALDKVTITTQCDRNRIYHFKQNNIVIEKEANPTIDNREILGAAGRR